MQWDLNADESGDYVDKVADMTGSIIALSFYYVPAQLITSLKLFFHKD